MTLQDMYEFFIVMDKRSIYCFTDRAIELFTVYHCILMCNKMMSYDNRECHQDRINE